MYTRRPMALSTRIAEFLGWELSSVAISESGTIQKALLGGRREGIVIGFDRIEQRLVWMPDKFSWGVRKGNRLLEEIVAKFVDGEDPR